MKVILLKDVPKLGKRYETKEVNAGHALNLLIPQGLVIVATPDAIKRVGLLKSKAVAAIHASAQVIGRPFRFLMTFTSAHFRHKARSNG